MHDDVKQAVEIRNTHFLWADRPLTSLTKLLDDLWITSQILLAADEDNRQILAEVQHFTDPLQVGRGTLEMAEEEPCGDFLSVSNVPYAS